VSGARLHPIEALGRTTLCRDLPRAAIEELAVRMTPRRYARGRFLWRSGDEARELWVLLEGSVKVFQFGPDGNQVIIHLHVPPDTVGEPGLFARERDRITEGQALSPVACLAIARAPLLEFLDRHPAALHAMLERLASMARGINEVLGAVVFHDVSARIASELVNLAGQHGEATREGVKIAVPVSQRTLAGMIGASRESVNRGLAQLAAAGIVRQHDGYLIVVDRRALEQLAGPALRKNR
jgi:CRP/FNR family transcriptional regulator, cyclic AMP receptor protein